MARSRRPPRPTSRGSRRRQGTIVSNAVNTDGSTKVAAGGTGTTSFTASELVRCNAAGDALESSGLTTAGVAPAAATYVTLSTNATLTNERVLTEGAGIDFADAGAGSTLTITVDLSELLHNDLGTKQGGTAGEFYHLTSVEYTGTGTGPFVRASSPTITTPFIATVYGSSSSGGTLTLSSTTHATKGFVVAGALYIDEASGRIGIGDATPDDKIEVTAGTLSTNERLLHVNCTHPSTTGDGATSPVYFDVTSAGSDAGNRRAFLVQFRAGYTGSSRTVAMEFENAVAGTGTDWVGFAGNSGIGGTCSATTTGTNIGVWSNTSNGNINIGVFGRTTTNKVNAVNVGVAGNSSNASSGGVPVGVYGTLTGGSDSITQPAAGLFNNGTTTHPIFVCQDNATTAFAVIDGGYAIAGGLTHPTLGSGVLPLIVATGSGASAVMGCLRYSSPGGGGSIIALGSSRGAAVNTYSALQSGDGVGQIIFQGDDGTDYVTSAATIRVTVNAASSTDTHTSIMAFWVADAGAAAEVARFDNKGSLLIGGTTSPTGTNNCVIQFADNGGNPTPASNSACVFGKDVAGTVEICVTDEAANTTQVSPHAYDSPGGMDDDMPLPIIIRHENHYTGHREWLHLSALAKAVEELTGKQFVFSEQMLETRDWDADQRMFEQQRERDLSVWKKHRARFEVHRDAALRGAKVENPESDPGPMPQKRPQKPMPAWMTKRLKGKNP